MASYRAPAPAQLRQICDSLGGAPWAQDIDRVFRKEFWLRGKDLNLRPLGYEFDLCFAWFHVVPYTSKT
jgi:hypothetical protein